MKHVELIDITSYDGGPYKKYVIGQIRDDEEYIRQQELTAALKRVDELLAEQGLYPG